MSASIQRRRLDHARAPIFIDMRSAPPAPAGLAPDGAGLRFRGVDRSGEALASSMSSLPFSKARRVNHQARRACALHRKRRSMMGLRRLTRPPWMQLIDVFAGNLLSGHQIAMPSSSEIPPFGDKRHARGVARFGNQRRSAPSTARGAWVQRHGSHTHRDAGAFHRRSPSATIVDSGVSGLSCEILSAALWLFHVSRGAAAPSDEFISSQPFLRLRADAHPGRLIRPLAVT